MFAIASVQVKSAYTLRLYSSEFSSLKTFLRVFSHYDCKKIDATKALTIHEVL